MSTHLYLVRHAIKEKGMGDVAISAQGILQAQATARYFRSIPLRAVFTSPLRRAQETAAYIAAEAGLSAVADSRLRERANWGDLPGQTFDEFVAMWEKCTNDPELVPPVGDSARQAGERLTSVLAETAGQYPGCSMVIVTHGGLITDFLVQACSAEQLHKWHSDFYAVQSELVPECSITRVICDGAAFRLDMFASVEHLHDV